jgi:choline-sulfatase
VKRPNILFVMTDQQRADSLGHAHPGASYTPTLDSLARQGVLFENAYASSTSCVPSRASLLTGILHHRLPRAANGLALPEGYWTIAHALQRAGYRTGLFGKMHFEPMRAKHGFELVRLCEHLTAAAGYDPNISDDYRDWLTGYGLADDRFKRPAVPKTFPYEARFHPTSWVTRQATEFLEHQNPDQPYFAVVSYPHPHTPYDPPDPYASMYDPETLDVPGDGIEINADLPGPFREAIFYESDDAFFRPKRVDAVSGLHFRRVLASIRALIRHIDDSIAELMNVVDLANTVVCFTSDHGDYGGHRGLLAKVPWIPFDDLAGVPLIFLGAGVQAGRVISEPVQAFDFALTALDVAGVAPPDAGFDGRSLWSVLGGGEVNAERPVFSATSQGWPMIRRGRYKDIWYPHSNSHVLYDMVADPGEKTNLATEPIFATLLEENVNVLREVLSQEAPNLWLRGARQLK